MIVHFSAHISKWELVSKFGVIFHIFIISCLCSRFHVRNQWFFYSVITFSYTKCFVHSYTVDVVFTLSYLINQSKLAQPWSELCLITLAPFLPCLVPGKALRQLHDHLHRYQGWIVLPAWNRTTGAVVNASLSWLKATTHAASQTKVVFFSANLWNGRAAHLGKTCNKSLIIEAQT